MSILCCQILFLSIYLFIYFWCPFFYFSYVFNMIHTSLHVQFSNIRTHSCLFLAASEYCELSLWLSPESCSVAELCLTLYDPMDSLSLGVCPSHVSWVDDAIQPPHPLPSSSLFAFSPSQHQDLFSDLAVGIRWLKYWRFSFSISPSSEYSGLMSFMILWFDLLAVQSFFIFFSSVYF